MREMEKQTRGGGGELGTPRRNKHSAKKGRKRPGGTTTTVRVWVRVRVRVRVTARVLVRVRVTARVRVPPE